MYSYGWTAGLELSSANLMIFWTVGTQRERTITEQDLDDGHCDQEKRKFPTSPLRTEHPAVSRMRPSRAKQDRDQAQ